MTLKDDSSSVSEKIKQLEEQERGNPKYWVKHINYDVEELMSDL